jgi:hypothetical protein
MQMAMRLHIRKAKKEACNQTMKQAIIQNVMRVMAATWPNTVYAIKGHSRYNYDPAIMYKVSLYHVLCYHNVKKDC